MDVQSENVDTQPCESQPSGKIRKGFKLFGKRKPGHIFSLKNNKSPVTRSQTLDGLPEGAAVDSEAVKEKTRELNQGDEEHAEGEPMLEDGVLAAARNSISSISSTKSVHFFSRLRGGRRGGGDRKVQTVSQPVTRQRQGLKGLFGSMKLRPKDKEDKVDSPPSPLFMSSRSNSVEIIKEDIGLTPKTPPRSLESPEKAGVQSSPKQAGHVSRTDEDGAPVPATEPPAVPAESSLGSLLDDISSLLTFESISGGDIMADMKAEWGKAKCASSPEPAEISTLDTSGSSISPPLNTSFSPVSAGRHSNTCVTTPPSSCVDKPVMASFPKSTPLMTQSVKPSLDSPIALEQSSIGITIKSTTTNIKPSPRPPMMSVPSISMKTIPDAPPSIQISRDKTQENSSTFDKVTSAETTPHPSPSPSTSQTNASVSQPLSVTTTPPASHKPATHSLSSPVTLTHPDRDCQTSSAKPQNVAKGLETTPSPNTNHPPSTPSATLPNISKPVSSISPWDSNRISIVPDDPQLEARPTTTNTIAKKSSFDNNSLAHSKEFPAIEKNLVSASQNLPPPVTVPKTTVVPPSEVPNSKDSSAAVPTSITSPVQAQNSVPVPKTSSAPVQIPVPRLPPIPTDSLCATTLVPLPSEALTSHKISTNDPTTNGQLSRLSSTDAHSAKLEEQNNGSRMDVPKERRTQVKALSKIPVVGGARTGKPAARDSQHADDDSRRDPPTPVQEDPCRLDLLITESRDKGASVEIHVATFKHCQEESQPPQQSKIPMNLPRDSKIPIKHGAQSPTASQIPQVKETPRTKIPVSRVPVRRVGNKPATAAVVRK
ncbi:uncharacterized protein LOC144068537 [Stigmatopora argus]